MKFRYDVAISFAVDNEDVATLITTALNKRGVQYYNYRDHEARVWGTPVMKETTDAYGMRSRYVLLITSMVYITRYWSGIERQIAIMSSRPGEPRILQLRLDDTPVDGISQYVSFREWQNDPEKIADLLVQKINMQKRAERTRLTRYCMAGLIALLSFLVVFFMTRPKQEIYIPVRVMEKILVASPTDSFYISETEVTIKQYREFCMARGIVLPPQHSSVYDTSPVVNITWEEAVAFCKWKGGRLPTQTEWEYAASAGLAVKYSGGNNAGKVAVYRKNRPYWVASKEPNMFGIFDMTGNVAEWCDDWSDTSAKWKAVRGGSYLSTIKPVNELAIVYRGKELPGNRRQDIGFRVAWDEK